MILVDWEIRQLYAQTYFIKPFDNFLVNPSSIDIRIGKTALLDYESGFIECVEFANYHQHNPYKLQPNESILVASMEYLSLPDDIACELKLKSSRAREGLSHALAGWIDNGFAGVLTLELKNYSTKHEVLIYPGLRIGQLILHKTRNPTEPYKGRYSGHNTVIPSLDK